MEELGRLQSMGVAKSRTRLRNFTFTKVLPKMKIYFVTIMTNNYIIITSSVSYSTKLNYSCLCAQSGLTLCDAMDCSPPGSSVHRILQARTLELVAISSPRGSSWSRQGSNPCLLLLLHWHLDSLVLCYYYYYCFHDSSSLWYSKYVIKHVERCLCMLKPHSCPWFTNHLSS